MKLLKTPPIMGAAIRFITSPPAPTDHMIGSSPNNMQATVITFGRSLPDRPLVISLSAPLLTMLADVIEGAAALVGRAKLSLDELRRYAAALRAAQGLCLQEALRFFPMDRVIRRFAKIWAETDPPAVKFMRQTGSVIELPVRAVLGAAGWAREKLSGAPAAVPPAEPAVQAAWTTPGDRSGRRTWCWGPGPATSSSWPICTAGRTAASSCRGPARPTSTPRATCTPR